MCVWLVKGSTEPTEAEGELFSTPSKSYESWKFSCTVGFGLNKNASLLVVMFKNHLSL